MLGRRGSVHATWPRGKGLFTCLYPPLGHELLMATIHTSLPSYPGTQGRPDNQQ